MNKGIDVSSHQGVIDWKQAKADAVEFAILRAGYGRELSQKDTSVDLNYSYEDYPAMMKTAGLNGYTKSNVPEYREHRVAKNENLWGIAEKYLGSGARYAEIKTLNNLKSDTIFTGQILKIPEK